jgi:DNA-binding IclR family transcriptional regulator
MEISQIVNLSPSTVSRLLSTLENYEYVKRDPSSLYYSLGYKLINLGAICLSAEDLRGIAKPYLVELRDLYNESVGLFVMSKTERVCIDRVLSTKPLHRVIDIGTRMMITRGASGKVLLAYQDEEFIKRLLREDPYVSLKELEKIRKDGYAVSYNEHEEGLASVAAPIFNAQHRLEAALFISGPITRINRHNVNEIIKETVKFANAISKKIGY